MTVLTRINRDGVAWLELARPDSRNALSTELLLALQSELASIHDDPATHVLVLSGSGTVFCAGADLKEFGPKPAAEKSLARVELIVAVLTQLRQSREAHDRRGQWRRHRRGLGPGDGV